MADLVLLTGVFFVLLLGLYILGVPIAFSIGISSVLIMLLPIGPSLNLQIIEQRLFSGMYSFILLAIPFFLLAGRIMNESGMTDDIFNFAEAVVRPLRGGLGHVNVIVSTIFSGMSGSAVADAAGLGIIEYNAMVERGYKDHFAVGITGSSAIIGPIIPPSIPMILYGSLANVSIGALFIAGVVPGLLIALSLMICVTIMSHYYGYSRSGENWNAREIFFNGLRAVPAFAAPVIIIGGILSGLFTPTEAAIVTGVYALLISYTYYEGIELRSLYTIFRDTFVDSSVLIFIVGIADLYGNLIVLSGIPPLLVDSITGFGDSTVMITAVLTLAILILGTFMSITAIIIVLVPLLAPIFPIVGIDPISFGVVMMVACMIGLITPPFGAILFVLERVTPVDFPNVVRGVAPFYVPIIIILAILILFPSISLFLPRISGLI